MEKPIEKLWHRGPNFAADAVVINGESILLIQRKDTGEWALPGGFTEADDDTLTTARRETREETGFILVENGCKIYEGKVDDPRNSQTSWIETSAYMFIVNSKSEVTGRDDAANAAWIPLDAIPDELYGSHRAIIDRALIIKSLENGSPETISGGHMSYEYSLLHTEYAGPVFTKQHIPSHHDNRQREIRSRLYLNKEANTLSHLREKSYPHIPRHSMLVDDQLLVMEGLPPSQDWHWRAPKNNFDMYVHECLTALRDLEDIAPLHADDLFSPSMFSFLDEGWRALSDPAQLDKVREKIVELEPELRPETVGIAIQLRQELESLRDLTIDAPMVCFNAFSHHDARQANIAWHPEQGAKIVDWSWAGPGVKGADTTSFLIDLAKSGHDVSSYLKEYFDPSHARLLIGFWLGHSLLPSKKGNEIVRLHQVASAATAYGLLESLD